MTWTKEQHAAYNKAHYQANKARYLERGRLWRAANKEKIKVYHKDHYASNKERYSAQGREYRIQHRDDPKYQLRRREAKLKHRYGVTTVQYEEMLKKQNGRCALCKTKAPLKKDGTPLYGKKNLAVDHGHMLPGLPSEKVRGLLCSDCNRMIIGTIESRRINPQAIVDYLRGRSWDAVLENPYV